MPILDPEDDHVPIPHRIEEFYQRIWMGGWGELETNWDVYSYKHGGMFMGCGQLEYKLIKLSLFGFPNTACYSWRESF